MAIKHPKIPLRNEKGKLLRAKWKSSEIIKKLANESRCFRCERRVCNTRICPLNPAVNPKTVIYPVVPIRRPNGGILRSKWKTVEKIEILKRDGRCFRCERQGCRTNICPLYPAVNPKLKEKRLKCMQVEAELGRTNS